MSRERIIGVLYILTFLLAAYIKFTNPHLFSVNSSKGIHEAASIAYLGQFYEDKLLWSRPVNSTKFAVSLWREVPLPSEISRPHIDHTIFKESDSTQSATKGQKRTFVVKHELSTTVRDASPTQQATSVRLHPYHFAPRSDPSNEVELGLAEPEAAGKYKVTVSEGDGTSSNVEEEIFELSAQDAGKIFFQKAFAPGREFRLRLWKQVEIDIPEINYELIGKLKKKVDDKPQSFYNLSYDELLIDLDKGSIETVQREVIAKDRSIMMKLIAENTRLAGTYSIDVMEQQGKLDFKSHIFDIAPKQEFDIVYPDFDEKPEQLAGVSYQDFVVTSQPMDGFMLVASDAARNDTMVCEITSGTHAPKITPVRSTGIDRNRGFQIKVNQDRKIVSFKLPLKSSKQITAVARAGRDEETKTWRVPIRPLVFSVWPPIQPRYWHDKEKDLYRKFTNRYPNQKNASAGRNDPSAPLLFEGRTVSVYYDLENVDRENYRSVTLQFSNGQSVSLQTDANPIEYNLPVDINWVRLTVNLNETSMSSTFAVKAVPDEFASKIELSPPLEMVSEYSMSTFRIVDYFGEFVGSDLIEVNVSGVPRNLVRMDKSDRDRVKVELIGIQAYSNIRASLTLAQSPYSNAKRSIDIGRVALKN